MGFPWPAFDHESLPENRAWSATFDSYDQHHDDCYYLVQLSGSGGADAAFMVQIGMEFAPDDRWDTPEFLAELRARIARVAETGKTNTTHAR